MARITYRATPSNPCPLCGATHGCCATEDGLHMCRKRQGEDVPGWFYLGQCRNLEWGMYRADGDSPDAPPGALSDFARRMIRDANPEPSATADKDPDASLRAWLERTKDAYKPISADQAVAWTRHLSLQNTRLFEQLGDILCAVPDERGHSEYLAFPERDGLGTIIGYSLRAWKGKKLSAGRRGITIPLAITPTTRRHIGPYYLVEGASDVLALLALGRNAIGRPSNVGGVEFLEQLFRRLPRDWWDAARQLKVPPWATIEDLAWDFNDPDSGWLDRDPDISMPPPIIVLAENDRKDNGSWPGRDGAYHTAEQLARRLGCRVRVAFPPEGSKDVRDWLRQQHRNGGSPKAADWDRRIFDTADVVGPKDPSRCHALGGGASSILDVPAEPLDLSFIDEFEPPPREPEDPEVLRRQEAADLETLKIMRRDFERFRCMKPRWIPLRQKYTGNPWLMLVRCEKRACPGCRDYLNNRELLNAERHFKRAVGGHQEQLLQIDCTKERWSALYAAIRAGHGQFLRIACVSDDGSDYYRVWTTAELVGSWKAAATPVAPEEALAFLKQRLPLCDGPVRPIVTSHRWKLPAEEEGSGQFKRFGKDVGGITESFTKEFVEELAQHTRSVTVSRVPNRRGGTIGLMVEFLRCGGWDENSLSVWKQSIQERFLVPYPNMIRETIGGRPVGSAASRGDVFDDESDWTPFDL